MRRTSESPELRDLLLADLRSWGEAFSGATAREVSGLGRVLATEFVLAGRGVRGTRIALERRWRDWQVRCLPRRAGMPVHRCALSIRCSGGFNDVTLYVICACNVTSPNNSHSVFTAAVQVCV